MAEYAFNSAKTFIGDPAGLSDIALRRRTDAMLSSALKHGTTDHLAPHPRQIEGDAKLDVPPLQWSEGDTLGNVQAMIDVSLASLARDVPDFRNVKVRYDFDTGTFRNSFGRVIADDDLGRATLKKGMLLKSLALAEGESHPDYWRVFLMSGVNVYSLPA